MAAIQFITVKTEFGPRTTLTLSLSEQKRYVRGAMAGLTRLFPDLSEKEILNTPWNMFTSMRRSAIRRDLQGKLHETGDLQPTE